MCINNLSTLQTIYEATSPQQCRAVDTGTSSHHCKDSLLHAQGSIMLIYMQHRGSDSVAHTVQLENCFLHAVSWDTCECLFNQEKCWFRPSAAAWGFNFAQGHFVVRTHWLPPFTKSPLTLCYGLVWTFVLCVHASEVLHYNELDKGFCDWSFSLNPICDSVGPIAISHCCTVALVFILQLLLSVNGHNDFNMTEWLKLHYCQSKSFQLRTEVSE